MIMPYNYYIYYEVYSLKTTLKVANGDTFVATSTKLTQSVINTMKQHIIDNLTKESYKGDVDASSVRLVCIQELEV